MNERERELYREALDTFGERPQYNMVIEEAGEVIQAFAKNMNRRKGGEMEHVIREMVQLQVVIEQMEVLFSERDGWLQYWYEIKEEELDRLERKLTEYKAKGD